MEFNKDAFSSGQLISKLWLCQELERLGWDSELTHIYAGWYGITAFLLLSREKFQVKRIESYDIDPSCEIVADTINENWVRNNWQFKAYTADCNQMPASAADLIINTSVEHFDNMQWFYNIPLGTAVILQGNNMPHDDHVLHFDSLKTFIEHFNLTKVIYSGAKDIEYPEWKFTRYMIIGFK
jgi:hypothetical protein